jgi:hypothetical protein
MEILSVLEDIVDPLVFVRVEVVGMALKRRFLLEVCALLDKIRDRSLRTMKKLALQLILPNRPLPHICQLLNV